MNFFFFLHLAVGSEATVRIRAWIWHNGCDIGRQEAHASRIEGTEHPPAGSGYHDLWDTTNLLLGDIVQNWGSFFLNEKCLSNKWSVTSQLL